VAAHIGWFISREKLGAFTARRQHARMKLLIFLRETIELLFEHIKLSPAPVAGAALRPRSIPRPLATKRAYRTTRKCP
jgi:hypothetical protein